jgi:hypothetical protein
MRRLRYRGNHRMMCLWLIGVFLFFQAFEFPLSGSWAEEYKFEVSEIEKKPYHVGGYLEFRPVLFGLDQNAAFYNLNLFDQNVGDTNGSG